MAPLVTVSCLGLGLDCVEGLFSVNVVLTATLVHENERSTLFQMVPVC